MGSLLKPLVKFDRIFFLKVGNCNAYICRYQYGYVRYSFARTLWDSWLEYLKNWCVSDSFWSVEWIIQILCYYMIKYKIVSVSPRYRFTADVYVKSTNVLQHSHRNVAVQGSLGPYLLEPLPRRGGDVVNCFNKDGFFIFTRAFTSCKRACISASLLFNEL